MKSPIIEIQRLNFYYGTFHALKEISMMFSENTITALIGPSGCGKSTLVRLVNRMSDMIEGARASGVLRVSGRDIFDPTYEISQLRREVGMVFQIPNPFPFSVYENLIFGHKIAGVSKKDEFERIVEESLKSVNLWDSLKDSLNVQALSLSADFQQRICIARAIAIKPKIILMDEPCSSLDPIATQKIEELVQELKSKYTIVIVTHSMQQAARVSNFTGYMLLGELIEFDKTATIFRNPKDSRTEDYISGKFG
ncbi:MAG: phosphate ABC transporter ATP-binding protein [Candidatus Riflebacteria bacterium]|nr:phosphate ABC transporter ATP-binding protein [Candidatus Riflebacteria bacterium]